MTRRKREERRPPSRSDSALQLPVSPPVSSLAPLREKVRASAENRPGVYRWLGPGDELLYVGKSVRIRSRLLSYFRAEGGEKPARVIREATRVDWEYVPNEFGALLREMRLIQRYRPRYNVQHKRKRSYAFVKITREPAPRVLPVSRVADDDATYFGPFPRVGRVGDTIRDLAYVLGLRDCPSTTPMAFGDQLEIFGGTLARRPLCLRGDLGTCMAPCCGRVDSHVYQERVRQARLFLEGRGRAPMETLQRHMAQAAGRKEFEYAALLRDRLERLRLFQEELAAFRGQVESLTFVYRVPGFRGADRVYLVRRGRVRAEEEHPKARRERARVAARAEEVFSEPDRGPGGLSSREAAEILFVARWFRLRPEELERTRSPEAWLAEKRPP